MTKTKSMKSKKSVSVVFTGGGTGGHIFPGLAVVEELLVLCGDISKTPKIFWLGNKKGVDRDLIQKSGIITKFYGLPCGKMRRYFSFANFFDLFKVLAGMVCAFFVLAKLRPKVLFSKGGFVSVPPCFAAFLLHIPIITHECDFTPGLATKINARFATKILVSYQKTLDYLPRHLQKKVIVTGNPVRRAFYVADKQRGFIFLGDGVNKDLPLLLVLGGSLGARQLNLLIFSNIDFLCRNFCVVHQTGKLDIQQAKQIKNKNYFAFDFIHNQMADVLCCADLVLCRSGANVLWENATLKKPMLLIPLCKEGSRGDQIDNAKYFANAGTAKALVAQDATNENLIKELTRLKDNDVRAKMKQCFDKILPKQSPSVLIAKEVLCYL